MERNAKYLDSAEAADPLRWLRVSRPGVANQEASGLRRRGDVFTCTPELIARRADVFTRYTSLGIGLPDGRERLLVRSPAKDEVTEQCLGDRADVNALTPP